MSKTTSYATSKPLDDTLEGTEKAGAGQEGGSNLPGSETDNHMAQRQILYKYYGIWLGGHWATEQDVYSLGAGG